MMSKPYQVRVFGKRGCDKCHVLNERLDKLLAREEWAAFEKRYLDVETEEGIIAFCEAECINPQRIPAVLVTRKDEDSGMYDPVPNPRPGQADDVCGPSRLYQYLGLQTDYSDRGRGVITPRMLTAVLKEATA
jgi:hypothetical protein